MHYGIYRDMSAWAGEREGAETFADTILGILASLQSQADDVGASVIAAVITSVFSNAKVKPVAQEERAALARDRLWAKGMALYESSGPDASHFKSARLYFSAAFILCGLCDSAQFFRQTVKPALRKSRVPKSMIMITVITRRRRRRRRKRSSGSGANTVMIPVLRSLCETLREPSIGAGSFVDAFLSTVEAADTLSTVLRLSVGVLLCARFLQ